MKHGDGPLLFFVALAMLSLIAWLLAKRFRRHEVWEEYARQKNLAFSGGRIAGVIDGHTVALFTEQRGDGEGSHTAGVVRCSLGGALPDDFTLARETLGTRLGQLVSGPDHQLGDPEMDRTFLLHHVDDRARRVLTDPRSRTLLLRTVERYPRLRIGNGALQLEVEPAPDSAERISALLDDAVELARALQRAGGR